MLPPSRKNGRFSSSCTSNCVRLTKAGSNCTWPKSGLTVASSVMFGHAVLEIAAHVPQVRAAVVEGIPRRIRRVVVPAPDHIGQDFHTLGRGEVLQPLK